MFNRIIDPSPTLKAFLDARERGATEQELEKLKSADEAARAKRPKARGAKPQLVVNRERQLVDDDRNGIECHDAK
jgi:hypothetical protein